MFRPLLAAVLIASPAAAFAQAQGGTGTPQRVRSVTLTGSEQCPKGAADEIVVCSRLNPDEQFRIPKRFRNDAPIAAQNQAWNNRAATIDEVGRLAGGLPNTCSAIGTGGQTGCFQQSAQAWAAERRAQRAAEENIPGTKRYQPAVEGE